MNSRLTKIRPVALVIIQNEGRILACPGNDFVSKTTFCRPIGGGIEFGETSLQAAAREVKEEIGATLLNARLITVIENVFTYNGEVGHEIVFLCAGELAERDLYEKESIPILDKEGMIAKWFPLEKIRSGELKMVPEGIQSYIP